MSLLLVDYYVRRGKAVKQEIRDTHLTQEVVGGESIIVPDSNFQGLLL